MADNVVLNPGSNGDTIAADDVGGAKYQYVKTAYGANNTATLTIDANPLPVSATGGRSYSNLSASTLVKTGAGQVVGIFVASSSSGTLKLWDNTSAATTILVNTFSAVAATWYPLPFSFTVGLYVTVGGTIDCTVSYT